MPSIKGPPLKRQQVLKKRHLLIRNVDAVSDAYFAGCGDRGLDWLNLAFPKLCLPSQSMQSRIEYTRRLFNYPFARMKYATHPKARGFVYVHAFRTENPPGSDFAFSHADEDGRYIKVGVAENVANRLVDLKRDARRRFKATYKDTLLVLPARRYAAGEYLEKCVQGSLDEYQWKTAASGITQANGEWFWDCWGASQILMRWFAAAHWVQEQSDG